MKTLKRWLLTTMAAVLLLPSVLFAASQPAQAQWGIGNVFDDAANPDPWTATQRFLENLKTTEQACKAFFTDDDGDPSGHCNEDGKKGDNKLPLYVQRVNSESDGEIVGYDPGNRPVAARIKKLKGNPYMVVGSEHEEDDYNPEDLPVGVEPGQMRFVLAEVNNKSKDDLDFTGSDEGNVFIWRNEFNPSLAIEAFYKPGSVTNLNSGDESHFAYDSQCIGSWGDGTQISDTAIKDDAPGTDAEDKEELAQWLEENKIKLNRICDENLNFFAQAMQNALESVAGFFSGLIDGLSSALGDIVDVGTIAQVPGLTNAWKTIRDFVNVIFILLLSVVAFATIIRLDTEKYSVRALLPRLVFAVIAVNFSLLMVQVLTNLAFIISQPFKETAFDLVTNPPASGSLIQPEAGIGEAAMAILVLVVIIVAMIVLLGFFVVRILVIWLLAALSPFVFLFMVLPVTRSLANSWWKNALKWIFMAPIAFVILFIAAEVVSGGRSIGQNTQDPGFILKIGFFAGALIAAVIIPLKLGGEVMGRAVGGAQKAGRLGRKGAGAAGGMAARKSGISAALEQRKARAEQAQSRRGAKWLSAADTGKGLVTAPLNPRAVTRGLKEGYQAGRDDGQNRLRAGFSAMGARGFAGRGLWGRKGRLLSEGGKRQLQEDHAAKLAGQFNGRELDQLGEKFRNNGYMGKTIDMAKDMRSGRFDERKQAERQAARLTNALQQTPEQIEASFGGHTGRMASQTWTPAMLAGTVRVASGGRVRTGDGKMREATAAERANAQRMVGLMTKESTAELLKTGDPAYMHSLDVAHRQGLLRGQAHHNVGTEVSSKPHDFRDAAQEVAGHDIYDI